jgi:hypothetical protein
MVIKIKPLYLSFLVISSTLAVCCVATGCSGEKDGESVQLEGGVEPGMDGARPRPDSGGALPGDAATEEAEIWPCTPPPYIDEYTDSGVNLYVYYGINTGREMPIAKFFFYCFTKGRNCEDYTVDLVLILCKEALSFYDRAEADHFSLVASIDYRAASCNDQYILFLFNPGELEGVALPSSSDPLVEIKGAAIETENWPTSESCSEGPDLNLRGSLKDVNFVDVNYYGDDAGSLEQYIMLRDANGNVVAEFR